MNTQEHTQGLIDQYIAEIAALGMQAQEGDDVMQSVSDVVVNAASHFAIVKIGTEEGNLKQFVGRLRILVDVPSASKPKYREVFESALKLASALLEKKQRNREEAHL